ncbi:MAG: ATP-binding cassette domain-containing protein [Arachnia propionica]|uniref:ABC transporter ATP-binding protein n=1 Tax=Arachnia propionica TaxID=1750 RepID=UPI0026FA6C36|nr:ATP-binding cassette domain-containing protein [Arachnia propionica]
MSGVADAAVRLHGVSHSYGARDALHGISTTFRVGVTGLLGPNGAGKTTLMKLVATAHPLQRGEITVGDVRLGRDTVDQVRSRIGYLPQQFTVMGWASVRQNVEYAAWAHGMGKRDIPDAVADALELVGLADRAASRARSLSGGMRQRLGLACALVHRPSILILDEPTVGLDPRHRQGLRQIISQAGEHAVVIVSTHLIEDLATSAHTVVVVDQGEIKFDDSMTAFRELGGNTHGEPELEAAYFAVLERRES